MGKKYELIFEVDLKIDLEDGSYDTCIEEFDFNLSPALIEKLIEEERFDPDVWYSHTFEGDRAKVVVKNSEIDDPGKNDIFAYGCICSILQLLKLPDGTVNLLVEGNDRIKITDFNDSG